MISVTFTSDVENIVATEHLYQWDNGQKLSISGVGTSADIHFANKKSEKALVVTPTVTSGKMVAPIPNSLLSEPYPIIAYVYVPSDDGSKTIKSVTINIEARKQPSDFILEEDEGITTLETISQRVNEVLQNATNQINTAVSNMNADYGNFKTTIQSELDDMVANTTVPNADTVDGKHASEIMVEKVSDTAELVTLDGLQGGVPFSDITISGKNLLKYPYAQTTNTNHGVTFTDNGDGSITASGTHDGGSDLSYFGFSPWWENTSGGRLFLPKGNTVTFRISGLPDTYQCMLSVKKDNTSTNGITARYGVGEAAAKYTAEQDCYIACGIYGSKSSIGQAVEFTAYPQLELGDTATAYEPPIIGQEIVLNVTSENMVKMPYYDGNNTEINGVTFTVNNDGSVTANGTPSASSIAYNVHYRTKETYLKLDPQKTYTLLGCPKGGATGTYALSARLYASESEITGNGMAGTLCRDTGNGYTFSGCVGMWLYIAIWEGTTAENLTFRPMVVEHSSEYSITPDSNPYTVPNDIRQQDGINNVSVSAGEVSVTGVNQNKAFKVIYKRGVPANGGNADTVDGKHASDLQPEVIPANSDTSVKTYAENYRSSTGIAYAEFAWRGYHATDAPATNGDFFFKAYKLTSANIRVIAYNLRKNETYEISKYNGTWSEWKRVCDGGNASTATKADIAGTLATTASNVCLRNISFGTADPQVTDSSAEGYVAEGALYGQYV